MTLDLALSIVLIVSACCYVLLGTGLITINKGVGSLPIGVLFIVISAWVIGGAIELLATNFTVFSIGRTGHFVGSALTPIVALVFFREYTQSKTRRSVLFFLGIIPVVSIFLAATNAYHELMWLSPFVNEAGEFLARPEQWGPWFLFVHLPYSYLLMSSAIIALIVHITAVAPAQRRGLFLLTTCCVVPLASTLAYDIGIGPNTLSYVPFFFAAMLPFYAWVIFGAKIIEFSPLPYDAVFQNMQDAVIVVDERRRIIGLNPSAERLLFVTEADALRQPLHTQLGEGWAEVFAALDSGRSKKMVTKFGNVLHVQVSVIKGSSRSGSDCQLLMFRDVSDVEKAHSEVQNSEKMLQTIIDHSANGIVRLRWVQVEDSKKQLRTIFANAAAGRSLDVDAKLLVNEGAGQILKLATAGMEPAAARDIQEKFKAAIAARKSLDVDVMQSGNGDGRWLRMICEPVGQDYAMTFVETTQRKAIEMELETNAAKDSLTGLLNRRGFESYATKRLAKGGDEGFGALLFIDLNGFKQINDQHGHDAGDEILKLAAQRLGKALRGDDIIGRPGGDEFVALVPDADENIAGNLAARLTEALDQPYVVGGTTVRCPASIGMAMYPTNAKTLTGLLREADQAMYRAKARTRDTGRIGSNDLLEKAV
ncbi:MAG: diguanylate cyclase [Gammaproteobacteria bacterium]|nr:diguanylate cyclase [Gammaproteobacteria bacterium]